MSKGNGAQLARQADNVQRGEAFWRAALSRQRASGLAQRAFCDREGLAVSTFSWWSRRIASAQAPAGAVQFVEVTPTAKRETGAWTWAAGSCSRSCVAERDAHAALGNARVRGDEAGRHAKEFRRTDRADEDGAAEEPDQR
jgi:hypothetical protein